MDKRAPAIGIDLGTTYSCMAYVDESDRTVVIKSFEGENTTPSVVAFEGTNVIVGRTAKESAAANPTGVVSFAKRRMGTKYRYDLEAGSYSPEEISAYILKKLIADASIALGMPITDAVITVPAYFGIDERNATKTAGDIAGINVLGIIPEPIAAAFAYGDIEKEKTVLVYDLGGGTFDVTLIKFSPGSYKTIVVFGDKELGGKDWDERIIRHLVAKFAEKTGTDEAELNEDPETMADLQDIAERVIKKTLTTRDSAKANVSHGGLREPVTITREEFNEMTADLVGRSISLTREALKQAAEKGVTSFDEILMVGGSTRMPQIPDALEKEFGMVPKIHEPDEAVGKGAAIVARNEAILRRILEEVGEIPKNPEDLSSEQQEKLKAIAENVGTDIGGLLGTGRTTYETVCSKSFGMVSLEMPSRVERVFNLILHNTDLPATREQTFYTIDDGQIDVNIRIMENVVSEDRAEIAESKELGKGILEFGRPMPKSTPIQVKFTMNADGTLEIGASESTTGKSVEVRIETPNVLQGDELEEARKRSSGVHL